MDTNVAPVKSIVADQINSCLVEDEKYPLLEEFTSITRVSNTYDNLEPLRFRVTRKMPFPAQQPEISGAVFTCFSGIFPEINRAWVTADSTLVLWNYQRNTFEHYPMEEVIVAIALVPPKPNFFVPEISHLLIVASKIEVAIVALEVTPDRILFRRTEYIRTTKGVVLKIASTAKGRIFLGTHSGDVYELKYEAQKDFFGNKVKLVDASQITSKLMKWVPFFKSSERKVIDMVVDDTRNILFVLLEQSVIKAFDLGEKGNELSLITSNIDISRDIVQLLGIRLTRDNENIAHVVKIAPIRSHESRSIALVAITERGLRIYFSLSLIRPYSLFFSFLRLPINYQAMDVNKTQGIYFNDGVFIYGDTRYTNISAVYQQPYSLEKAINVAASGTFKEGSAIVQDVPPDQYAFAESPCWFKLGKSEKLVLRNQLAMQHQIPSRQFLSFTPASGLTMFCQARPLDDLRDLFSNSKADSMEVAGFRAAFGEVEFCAMCLALICTPKIFSDGTPSSIANVATSAFFGFANPSPRRENVQHLDQTRLIYQPSFCQLGLRKYISRILRPIWREYLVRQIYSPIGFFPPASQQRFQLKTLKPERLSRVKQFLVPLKDFFLSSNWPKPATGGASLNVPMNVNTYNQDSGAQDYTLAAKTERIGLENLQGVVTKSLEAVDVWLMFLKYDLAFFQQSLTPIQLHRLTTTAFQTFIGAEGIPLGRELVSSFISFANAHTPADPTNSIADELHRIAPTLFDIEAHTKFKGFECIEKAQQQAQIPPVKDKILQESLNHFMTIPHAVAQQLPTICTNYLDLDFPLGIVYLCLACAAAVDPQNMAMMWVRNGRPERDEDGRLAFANRERCYGHIWSLLNRFNSGVLGPEKLTDILKAARRSTDEMFHIRLYEWYISEKLQQDLIKLNTPYLENFLTKYCPQDIRFDLLPSYYIRNEKYFLASRVLLQQAETSVDISLIERIQLLARAQTAFKSAQAAGDPLANQQKQKDLDERIEVANVQEKTLKEIEAVSPGSPAIAQLNAKLLDNSTLYNQIILANSCPEAALASMKAGGLHDRFRIERFLGYIIENLGNNLVLLQQRMVSLGKEHYGSVVFPLDFVIYRLEFIRISANPDNTNYVISIMRQIGIPWSVLFLEYMKICEIFFNPVPATEEKFRTQANLLHLLHAVYVIINTWAGELMQPTSTLTETKIFRECKVVDTIFKINMRLKTVMDDDANKLGKLFKSLADNIQAKGL